MKKLSLFIAICTTFFVGTGISAAEKYKKCDYIIIGNGTAGATLARELSDDYKNSVLVLERGSNLTSDPVVLNPSYFASGGPLTYNPLYAVNDIVQVDFPGMATQYFIYSDGNIWGGSSATNRLFAVRGTPRVYNKWATLSGESRWSYNNLLPLFLATEHYTPNGTVADTTQRGLEGSLFITQGPPVTSDPFSIGCSTALGIPFANDYNNPSQGGDVCVAAHQEFVTPLPDSHRSFSANAFIDVGTIVDANGYGLNGRKLRIISNSLVDKVIFDNYKAVGVQYYSEGNLENSTYVEARHKIIICAGASRTPGILERSGIGDGSLLTSLGIDVVVDNPNVGEHLLNHYGAIGLYLGTTTAKPNLNVFSDNGVGDGVRRIQAAGFSPPGSGITIFAGGLTNPKSEGSVHIVSSNPFAHPKINFNMYSDAPLGTPGSDADHVVTFMKTFPAISAASGFPLLSPPPSVYAAGDEALLSFAKNLSNALVGFHNVGTARMGRCAENAVVDGDLHVFGVRNLMVADVSIEPEIEDGNTAYAAYFIGKQAANIIKHSD